jgi:nitrate/nitrite-specific signal transduction histidine kinase
MAREDDARIEPDAQLQALRVENQRLSRRVLELERANTQLSTLYVASHRLQSALGRQEVFTALAEVMANLLGTEEFALFELDRVRSRLELTTCVGVDRAEHQNLALSPGLIGATASSGQRYRRGVGVEPTLASERHLTACEPLLVGDAVTGVIAVFGLLSHKPQLTQLDDQLLALLGVQVGTALQHAREFGVELRLAGE